MFSVHGSTRLAPTICQHCASTLKPRTVEYSSLDRTRDVDCTVGIVIEAYVRAASNLKGYEPQYGEPVDGFQTPNLPTGEMPTDEMIKHITSRYNKRRHAKDAREPIPFRLETDDPGGLLFFGDPHLDSPQCETGRNYGAVWPYASPRRA